MNDPVRFFKYGKKELEHLSAADPQLSKAIEKLGFIRRETDSDVFRSAIFHIIGQQVSGAAQKTVFSRLSRQTGGITPENILALGAEELRGAGMSGRKAGYITALAESAVSGEFNPPALRLMDDESVIKKLCGFAGVGRWTAEMLLIFSFERGNVFSFGDFGIRKGLQLLHCHDALNKKLFSEYARLYSPYCTTASFYLWEIAAGKTRTD